MNFSFKQVKVGQNVKGVVVDVKDDVILLDINYISEGTIYRDKFSNDKTITSLKDIVKIGDIIEAQVGKVNEEDGVVLLTRLPLIKKDDFNKVKEAYQNHTTIDAKIVKSVNKGFILDYKGNELFMPEGQLDINENVDKDSFIGKEVTVRVIDMDHKSNHSKTIVSRKVLQKEELANKKANEYDSIAIGKTIKGKVSNIVSYGAFIKFEYNQGLLRTSQISHQRFNKIEDVLKVGEEIEVKVIGKENGKLDLSRKALLKTPYELYEESHQIKDTVKGKVIQKLPFGLILELERDVTGLLHKNEYTWNPNDNSLNYVKLLDEIECQILSIDAKHKKISLSKKALDDNPWSHVTVKRDDLVTATVSNVTTKGLEVLVQGVVGFVPANELSQEKTAKIEEMYKVGEEIKAYIIDINKATWEMKLSIKKYLLEVERNQFEKYMKENQQEQVNVTLGDLFKDVLIENPKKKTTKKTKEE